MLPILYFLGASAILAGALLPGRYRGRDRQRKPDAVPIAVGLIVIGFIVLAVAVQLNQRPDSEWGGVLTASVVAAAGVVTAVFGFWLNHRRYQIEESHQQVERNKVDLEHRRHKLDQEKAELEFKKDRREHAKVADESVLHAVELLGNPEPRVRSGALHVLAGLAADRPDRAQQAADLVCMFLRTATSDDPACTEAQRVLHRILLVANNATQPVDDLEIDLSGARLDGLVLGHVTVRALNLTGATLSGRTSLHRLWTTKRPVPESLAHGITLDGATFGGPVLLNHAELKSLSAKGAHFNGGLSLAGSVIEDEVRLSDGELAGDAEFTQATIGTLNCGAAKFFGQASFRHLTLRGAASFVRARFHRADFELVRCGSIVFDNAHFEEGLTFVPSGTVPHVSLRQTTVGMPAIVNARLRLPPTWHAITSGSKSIAQLIEKR